LYIIDELEPAMKDTAWLAWSAVDAEAQTAIVQLMAATPT
jgi:hypothetical protein